MYYYQNQALTKIVKRLKKELSGRIISIYAFGSRVRGDHNGWSDFDILVIVNQKAPDLEAQIISIFIDEEVKSGLSFTPLIKDSKAFEMEKKFNTPFYENISKEGVLL
ncbi:MAG: nucleotidyltransferase domain-containing protein [bacterium]